VCWFLVKFLSFFLLGDVCYIDECTWQEALVLFYHFLPLFEWLIIVVKAK
jgi:hypothetical protein